MLGEKVGDVSLEAFFVLSPCKGILLIIFINASSILMYLPYLPYLPKVLGSRVNAPNRLKAYKYNYLAYVLPYFVLHR